VEGGASADTKSDSAQSHVHVAVDQHPADDATQFHRKFRSMASEEFDAVIDKAHGPADPPGRMQHGHCCTIESLHTLTWSETRGHPEGKLCDTASDPSGFIGSLFGRIYLNGDPGHEFRRLFGITEKNGNPIR
jgi:hypothetical protein